MISLLRCDDRLIHGQCMTSIVKRYDIKDIIVIDNYTAANPMMKKIFQTAVPKGIRVFPVTLEESSEKIREAESNDVNTLILMRLPSTMLAVYKLLPELPKDFNIANVCAKDGTITVTNYARFNMEEISAVKEMDAMGVHVWFNTIQGQTVTEWKNIKTKF